jgi:fructose-specific phosphotransferase system IIC component
MKALFVLLVLSTLAIVVAAIAMWWRLRRHLHQSDEVLKEVLQEMEPEIKPEHEPVER